MVFTTLLLGWYGDNGRDLPWKTYKDPYTIWVSEVILQQTRVQQGETYFRNFISTFPTVRHLAEASVDDVLKLWQGLGYYSRARNMHKTARKIVDEYGGMFPKDVESLKKLDGIGPYTASAVASFAYGIPAVALDGNGYRILARYFGIDLPLGSPSAVKTFRELAVSLLPEGKSADFNQALMDFGSFVCMPRPLCVSCPLADHCIAYNTGLAESLPVKPRKAGHRTRYFHYLDFGQDTFTFIGQRKGNDIWKGLYEFPLIETSMPATYPDLIRSERFRILVGTSDYVLNNTQALKPHKLTHQSIHPVFYRISITGPAPNLEKEYKKVPREELSKYAVSRLTEKYMNFFHNFAGL